MSLFVMELNKGSFTGGLKIFSLLLLNLLLKQLIRQIIQTWILVSIKLIFLLQIYITD